MTCGRVFQHDFILKVNLKNLEQGFLVHRFYLLRKQKDCLWQGQFQTTLEDGTQEDADNTQCC